MRNNPPIDRRQVLKATATSVAGLAGYSGVSGAVEGVQPVNAKGPEFSDDMTSGYALGRLNNPVDATTIKRIQKKVLGTVDGGVIVNDPTAEPAEEYQIDNSADQIIGYGLKLEDGDPNILIKRRPIIVSSSEDPHALANELPAAARTAITRNVHDQVLNFIENGKGDK